MLPFLIILVILGAVLEILSLRRDPSLLEMEYFISKDATEPGKPFTVQSVLTNKSRIPVSYLAVREIFPESAVVPEGVTTRPAKNGLLVKNIYRMKGLQRKKPELELTIYKRGVHVFIADSIEFGDFLGFGSITKKIGQRREIVVYPEELNDPDISKALSSFCGDVAARRFLIRDPILTAGTREYTGREPMKQIHWLQSASRGSLMVREYEYSRQPSACVILNVDEIGQEDSDMDRLCSLTRSVCRELLDIGAVLDFYTNSMLKRREKRDVWKCEASPGHISTLLDGLARATYETSVTSERLLRQALRDSDPDTSFIVVMSENNTSGAQLVESLRQMSGREFLVITDRCSAPDKTGSP